MTDSNKQPSTTPTKGSGWTTRVFVLAIVGLAAALAYVSLKDYLSFEALAAREAALQQLVSQHYTAAIAIAFATYVVVTGLSLPGALVMTLVIGWAFGFATGTVIVSFASTLGATTAFLFARFLFRDALRQKFGHRIQSFEQNLERDGAFYLFSLRLIAGVPFWMINLLMGLTPIRTKTFWWVSQLGMLPGTMAYVYAGSTIDLQAAAANGIAGLVSKKVLLALTIVGLLPIAIKKAVQRFRTEPRVDAFQTADTPDSSEQL